MQLKRRYQIGNHSYSLFQINKRIDQINAKCDVTINKPSDLVLRYTQIKSDQERLISESSVLTEELSKREEIQRQLQKQLMEIENEFGSYEFVLRRGTQEEYHRKMTMMASRRRHIRETNAKVKYDTSVSHSGNSGPFEKAYAV